MEATCLDFVCLVRAEEEQFIHLRFHEAKISTPIFTYFSSSGSLGRSVTRQDVMYILCLWMANIGFLWLKFHPKTIVPH